MKITPENSWTFTKKMEEARNIIHVLSCCRNIEKTLANTEESKHAVNMFSDEIRGSGDSYLKDALKVFLLSILTVAESNANKRLDEINKELSNLE